MQSNADSDESPDGGLKRVSLLLLSFEFATVARPCDLFESDDARPLAVRFKSFAVLDSAEDTVGSYDLTEQSPRGAHKLFGLSSFEPWGVWSEGKRTGLLFELSRAPDGPARIRVRYEMQAYGPTRISTDVRVNGFFIGRAHFQLTECELDIIVPPSCFSLAADQEPQKTLPPQLSVLIVNYNRWELTCACILTALASQPPFPHELLVVDNGSSGTDVWKIQSYGLPVEVIRLDERRSFGEANNYAAERARGRHLLLLNNDAFVESDCIRQLTDALEDPAIGAAGAVFEYPDGRLQEAGGFINVDGHAVQRSQKNFQGQAEELPPISPVEYISAACLLVRRADFSALSGFHPAYEPAYHEDTDLCCRIRATGKQIALVRDARVVHLLNATVAQLPSSDPARTSWARNYEVFRSRWGAWLWRREVRDEESAETSLLDGRQLENRNDYEKQVEIVVSTDALGVDTGTRGVLSLCSAIAQQRATLLSTATPYSWFRLRHLLQEFSLPRARMGLTDDRSLSGASIAVAVRSTCEIPPRVLDYGVRRILHCPMPVRARRLSPSEAQARVEALRTYQVAVTNSEMAKQRLRSILDYIGAPELPVLVIHPPLAKAQGSENNRKQDLILSIGPFRRGARAGSHDVVLRAFNRFCATRAVGAWKLVCVGNIETPADVSYLAELRDSMANPNVRFFVTPTPAQAEDLFKRAKICVSAPHCPSSVARGEALEPASATEIGRALSYGCMPIVPAGGVEAELCGKVGVGLTFYCLDDLEEQLAMAASLGSSTVWAHLHRHFDLVSASAFDEGWRGLLDARAMAAA